MGCVPSSDADRPTAPQSGLPNANAQEKSNQQKSARPAQTRDEKKPAAASHAGEYDTELAASLSGGQGGTVAYHGLLVNPGQLDLKRAIADGSKKVFEKPVHPSDDGNAEDSPSSPENSITTVRGLAMTMPYTIIVAASSADDNVKRITSSVFDEANKTINGWNPESEVSKLNRTPPGKSIQIGSTLMELFDLVDQVFSITNGRFDPTTGALTVAFENSITTKKRPPLPSELKPLKHGIGWQKRIERKGSKVSRMNANTIVDLDGISKGFVIDKLITALQKEGYKSFYVDWAGDVRAVGKHPSGRSWRSAVLMPPELRRMFAHWQNGTLQEMLQRDDIGFLADFSFHDSGEGGAIATSGDYFSMQKYGYHHIANGEQLTVLKASQTSVASVCVAASTCAVADACATAAMTFEDVKSATSFLKNIQSNSPELVSAYCVLNREHPGPDSPRTYSSHVFLPTVSSDSSTLETKTTDSRNNSGMSEEIVSNFRKTVTRNVAEVHFNNSRIVVDSFTPCSLVPEQLITFICAASFVSGASMDQAKGGNKLFAYILGLVSGDLYEHETQVRVDMTFRKIIAQGESVLVVAAIESVDLGSATSIRIPHRDGAPIMRAMQLGIPRSTFKIASVIDQTKELFRQVPAAVWVLGTKTADQVELAITATSVTIPSLLRNEICFNISHSSTFFAGIGGVGSRIRGHALSSTQRKAAATFVTKSNMNLDDISNLESDSLLTVDCTIELVESIQDHIIVLARVVDARYAEKSRQPLLWLQGGYLDV